VQRRNASHNAEKVNKAHMWAWQAVILSL